MSIEPGVLEVLAKSIYDTLEGDAWSKRIAVAWFFGNYMDAKHMVYMMQTHGLPLWAYVDHYRKTRPDAKLPLVGLRHELAVIGKNPGSIDSALKELQLTESMVAVSE